MDATKYEKAINNLKASIRACQRIGLEIACSADSENTLLIYPKSETNKPDFDARDYDFVKL